ncbi:MAG: hypothetical protein WA397_17445 [Roseiarcus sp.]
MSNLEPRVSAIVVLGMHRSGTSSVAGALIHLGGGAPTHLMDPAPCNERGFWESPLIMALNDEILEAAGSHWADCRPFDHGRLAQPVASELRARAAATLISEFGETERPVVKDPRMCRLLDFWEPVFKDVGWSTRVVLPIRSPLEVARSLETRDGMVAGVGCLLWLRHVLDAEARSRGSLRSFIEWSSLLTDRRGTLEHVATQLELDWLLSSDEAMTDADAFVSSELRHFESSAQETAADPVASQLADAVYDQMRFLADDPYDCLPLSRLDDLRGQFEASVAFLEPILRQQADERIHLRRELATTQARLNSCLDRERRVIELEKQRAVARSAPWRRLASACLGHARTQPA